MVVFDPSDQSVQAIDFRETAPQNSTVDMFMGDAELSSTVRERERERDRGREGKREGEREKGRQRVGGREREREGEQDRQTQR